MPLLMSDVAAGSQAALQLQQNMAAAPNVQQVEANRMQEQQLKLQQEQANVERSKLVNLMTDTGFKASQESKAALQKLVSSPDYQSADDVKRLQMMAAKQFEAGDVENGAKTLQSSELYASRKIADSQKQLDQNAQQIGNVFAVVSALKTPEQQSKFFDELKTQKPEEYKLLLKEIGPETFEKMSPGEKTKALEGLMFNAKGQLATQLKATELEKAKIHAESNERIARTKADAAIEAKIIGHSGSSDKEERLGWSSYERADQAIDKVSEKQITALQKKVDDADEARIKSIPWYSKEPSDAANTAYLKAVKEKNDYEKSIIKKKLDLAVTAPKFPGKEVIVEELQRQLAAYPPPPASDTGDKSKGDTGRGKIETPKTVTGGATSNKLSGDDQAALDWANSNPTDPRAKKIKERLGVK